MKHTGRIAIILSLIWINSQPHACDSPISATVITDAESKKLAETVNNWASKNVAYSLPDTKSQNIESVASTDMKTTIAKAVASVFSQDPFSSNDKLDSQSSTNIRCVAEPADSQKPSDSKLAPVTQPTEAPKYAQAIALTGGKDSGSLLSLLPIRLSLSDLSLFKRAALSETSETVAASEQQKTRESKPTVNIPDNLFIPIDIGLAIRNTGLSSQPKATATEQKSYQLHPEIQKVIDSFKNPKSLEPKTTISYSHPTKYVAKKKGGEPHGYGPNPKYSDYSKYPGKNYGSKAYATSYRPYSYSETRSPKQEGSHYRPSYHKTYSPSESRPNYEKTKVSEDQNGCKTIIKEIQDVPGRSRRNVNEPRVVIMTKECYNPDDKAASVKAPDYHSNYYPGYRSTVKPVTRHYQSSQNRPNYVPVYKDHDYYHSPSRDTSYATYRDPYHYDGSTSYPHQNYYRYPYYPVYSHGQRRSSDDKDRHDEPRSHHETSHHKESKHREPKRARHDDEEHDDKERTQKSATEDHRSDHHHHHHRNHPTPRHHHHHHRNEKAKNTKTTPKTVTRSFAYYRKDNDDGKDPHNHEEGEEYAQGNYRSFSTSYDSDRDGPR